MWIKTTVLLCLVAAALSADAPKKKEENRGKRNLGYLSHHYPHSSYRLERRITSGSHIPPLYQSQFFPGPPRSPSSYHKGRPYSLPPPPYAVQMEPLVHYSQRDPLYETNILSLNADGHHEDLLPDNNHLSETHYGPPKRIIERPIYVKAPEPIIEIIIKESNVTLPPPPAPPTPPPKKKEQVQVFYVKYKKNPNATGKDSVIYDKPIPAISPPIEDEQEEPPPQIHHEIVTSPPPPSTTLRTIIHPDSETYHSPSGVKVTFGKESFDHAKRQNKPEDLKAAPQGRQLSAFPPNFPRRPPEYTFNGPPTNFRHPQPYRPFSQYRQTVPRSPPEQYSTLPKFPPPRPALPQFQRQPVPYQPFDNNRQQPQVQFRPEPHFPVTQAPPITQKPVVFRQEQRFNPQPQPQFRPQPQPQFNQQFNRQQFNHQQQQFNQQARPQPQQQFNQQSQPQFGHQQPSIIPPGGELIQSLPKFEQHISVQESSQPQPQRPQVQPQPQQTHLSPTQYNDKIQQQFREAAALQESIRQSPPQPQPQQSHLQYNDKIQQQFREAAALQESIRQSPAQPQPQQYNDKIQEQFREPQPPYYNFQQSQQLDFYQSTPKPTTFNTPTPRLTTTTTPTTTTTQPSTTTKDPKLLEAQLPDEVPDDLRQQLLSSGILNNAQISILDYDKVGDIPLSALPPDQLANFYSAGGAQQIQAAGSVPVPAALTRGGDPVEYHPESSEIHEVTVKPEVEMKVVRYDPQSDQEVQKSLVKDDATQVDPVVLDDARYNRYLPLKVNGAQFPIPDVPELKGKKVSSVVVLAPVAYDFSSTRKAREAKNDDIELVEGQLLKELLKNPSEDNFNKFLEKENQTRSDKQAVILLVTGTEDESKDREIFMYDVATRTVSKLSGELSTAFVDAAEANSSPDAEASESEIVETRVPYEMPIIDPEGDLQVDASENLDSFVESPVDMAASESHQDNNYVSFAN